MGGRACAKVVDPGYAVLDQRIRRLFSPTCGHKDSSYLIQPADCETTPRPRAVDRYMVGPVDSAHALQVEGSWYWPATPRPLIDATADLHAERIDPETWQQRVAARAPYRLPPAACRPSNTPTTKDTSAPPAPGSREGPLPSQASAAPRPPEPPPTPARRSRTLTRRPSQDLPPNHHHLAARGRSHPPHPRHRPHLHPPGLPTPPRQHPQARHLGRHPRRRKRQTATTAPHPKTQEQAARHLDTRRTPRPRAGGSLTAAP